MGPQRMYGMTPWVRRLLVANLLVFLLQKTVFLHLAAELGFAPLQALTHPWTLVTYMFLHGGDAHLAFNPLALYGFRPPVEERLGGRGGAPRPLGRHRDRVPVAQGGRLAAEPGGAAAAWRCSGGTDRRAGGAGPSGGARGARERCRRQAASGEPRPRPG